LQHLIGAGTDPQIFCQVNPTHNAGGIDQELGGTRDVVSVHTSALMQQIVPSDYFCVGVGKKGIGVTGLAA